MPQNDKEPNTLAAHNVQVGDVGVDFLHKLLRYDPLTGLLFWRERGVEMFSGDKYSPERSCKSWNGRYAGKEAFTAIDPKGYKLGAIFNKTHKAHRVIWAMENGDWPADHVDHIDNDGLNNRISNLRAASNQQNGCNRAAQSNSLSGVKGVCWDKANNKWLAQIGANGKRKYLGVFAKIEDAALAYARAADALHGEFANPGKYTGPDGAVVTVEELG